MNEFKDLHIKHEIAISKFKDAVKELKEIGIIVDFNFNIDNLVSRIKDYYSTPHNDD